MGSLKRKLARNKMKKVKSKIKKTLKKTVSLMLDAMPNNCVLCNEKFDRDSKEHALSWRVRVTEKDEKVELYCKKCASDNEELFN